jgi:hypothetical protein
VMWKKLLARAHPDAGGDHELFVWARSLQEKVCGRPPAPRASTPKEEPARVPFDWDGSFDELTERALDKADAMAEEEDVELIYVRLLFHLEDCEELEDWTRQQTQGATYKTLAAIGHAAGMDAAQRSCWYKVAERIPLSQRHAGHILTRLKEGHE